MRYILLLFLLIPSWAFALDVTLTTKDGAGVTRTGQYLSYGVPLAQSDNITSISGLRVTESDGTTAVDAQFDVLARYADTPDGSGAVRMLLVTFAADVTADSTATYHLKDGGSGNASGSDLASSSAGITTIATGAMSADIKETAGFNLFETITVDAVDLVNSPTSDGVIARSGGVDYTSYNDADAPTVTIERNGPLMTMVSVEGYLEDSSNNKLIPSGGADGMKYKVWIKAYKNTRQLYTTVTIKNENDGYVASGGTNQNISLDYLYLRTTLAGLGTPSAVRFSGWEDTSPSGAYTVKQDHSNNQASELDTEATPNFSYSIKEGVTERATGTRFNGYSQLRDSSRGLMVASRWFWQNWTKEVEIDATNKRVDFYLWPDETSDHVFLGAIWKTHDLVYDFHDNVSTSYTFAEELASLKSPLPLFADNFSTSNFLDYIPASGVTSSVTFNGDANQKLQPALTKWDETILAKFDSTYADVNTETLTSIRESRPYTWSSGVYSGEATSMYGWLDFGDFIRSGGYGFGSQNYDWAYTALVTANRFKDTSILDLASDMSQHYGDILILHNPYSSTLVGSAGLDQRSVHGSQIGEMDAHRQLGSWVNVTNGFGLSEPGYFDHMWPKSQPLQYLLTGHPKYLDVIDDISNHIKYQYSGLTAEQGTQTNINRTCNVGACYSDLSANSRSYTKMISAASDFWSVTGDSDMMTVVEGVFNNAILNNELEVSGEKKGVQEFATDQAWMLYATIEVKELIKLHKALVEDGDTTTAASVEAYLTRHAEWMRDDVYTHWDSNQSGDYNGATYFPYIVSTGWTSGSPWVFGSQANMDITYSFSHSDLFAWMYQQTSTQSWLDLARATFKDGMAYSSSNTWQTINTDDPLNVSGIIEWQSSWLKEAKSLEKPMYFVWSEGGGTTYTPINPSSTTHLRAGTTRTYNGTTPIR